MKAVQRACALMGAVAIVAGVVIILLALARSSAGDDGGAEVVGGSPRSGWKTIEYDGVRVDIPTAWERLDLSGCEFQFERWGEPTSDPCDEEQGAAFYASATFDPATGPGVRRTTGGEPVWGGYAYTGQYAVYVADNDRDVVHVVLDSVGRDRLEGDQPAVDPPQARKVVGAWRVVSVRGEDPPADAVRGLQMSRVGGRYWASWSDGVNQHSVTWELAPDGEFHASRAVSTLVGCQGRCDRPSGFGVRSAESIGLTAHGQLVFLDARGAELSRYRRAG